MARVVSPIGISSPLVLADFYREEFLRHRECLAQQREYYSERAITDADGAIVGSAFEGGGRGGAVQVDAVREYVEIVSRLQ